MNFEARKKIMLTYAMIRVLPNPTFFVLFIMNHPWMNLRVRVQKLRSKQFRQFLKKSLKLRRQKYFQNRNALLGTPVPYRIYFPFRRPLSILPSHQSVLAPLILSFFFMPLSFSSRVQDESKRLTWKPFRPCAIKGRRRRSLSKSSDARC